MNSIELFAQACNKKYLGVPAWYNDVNVEDGSGVCSVNFSEGFDVFIIIGSNLLQGLFAVVGYVAVFYIIYAGILFVTSQGEPSGIASAKSRLQSAIIGLIIIIISYAIVGAVASQFGVSLDEVN